MSSDLCTTGVDKSKLHCCMVGVVCCIALHLQRRMQCNTTQQPTRVVYLFHYQFGSTIRFPLKVSALANLSVVSSVALYNTSMCLRSPIDNSRIVSLFTNFVPVSICQFDPKSPVGRALSPHFNLTENFPFLLPIFFALEDCTIEIAFHCAV